MYKNIALRPVAKWQPAFCVLLTFLPFYSNISSVDIIKKMTGASIKMKAKSKKSMAVQTILRIIALGVIFVMVSFGTGCSGKYCVKTAQA